MSSPNIAVDELRQFFGGYFHQDWDLSGATSAEVLAELFRSVPQDERLRELAASLRKLLHEYSSDAELQSFLANVLWCEYVPEGGRTSAWIGGLASEIDSELARRTNQVK